MIKIRWAQEIGVPRKERRLRLAIGDRSIHISRKEAANLYCDIHHRIDVVKEGGKRGGKK